MQTLDAIQTNSDTTAYTELMGVLEDIAKHVEIRDDFSIHHPSYKPLEIPVEAIERFQKMPEQMRQKFLSLQLRSFLYGIYYNGAMRSSLALDAPDQPVQLDLENNTVMGIDTAFFQQLHDSNCGEGYFDGGWRVLKEEEDGSLAVRNGSLRLHIRRDRHLREIEQQAQVGDVVAVKMPKNRMQNGFYMAVGNLGFSHPQPGDALVRIYFNMTAAGSIAVMKSLTQELNAFGISFSFKVLYNPKDYNRFDSGVLYFDWQDYEVVLRTLDSIYTEHQSYFIPKIPLFTKQLALGLGLAEEPEQKFAERESFGMNRCQIVANGLLKLFYQGQNSAGERMKAISDQFSLVGIDLQHPHINSGSKDVYRAIN
jgi:HopA1 effector protein family